MLHFKKNHFPAFALFTFISVIFIAIAYLIPQICLDLIPLIQTVSPVDTSISRNVYTSGVVEERTRREVRAELPLVPQQVMVAVGDVVAPNQIIATIDKAATQAALFSLADSAKLIPAEYAEAFSGFSVTSDFIKSKLPDFLTAPMAGTITGLSLVQGAISTPQSVVCTISSIDSLRLRLSVDEAEVSKVKVGDKVVVKATATQEAEYVGAIEKIFPTAAKELSGTSTKTVVSLYVKPVGETGALKPGYNVTGSIIIGASEVVRIIPYEAVCQDEENIEFVWLYRDGRCYRQDITTGEEFAQGVEVTKGLGAGTLIVKKPIPGLKNGEQVRWKK